MRPNWLSARKKFKGGGGGKRQWTIVFQNTRLLFPLFFLLFFRQFKEGKVVLGGPPAPCSRKPASLCFMLRHTLKPGEALQLHLYGGVWQLIHLQTKAGPSMNKDRPILRLFPIEID